MIRIFRLLQIFFLAFRISFKDSLYNRFLSIITFVWTYLKLTYSCSKPFTQNYQPVWGRLRLKENGRSESTAVYERLVERVVQGRSKDSALFCMDGDLYHLTDQMIQANNTRYILMSWALLIIKLFKSGAEENEKKVVKLLHCNNVNIESIQHELRWVKTYSDLVQVNSGHILEN